MEHPNLIGAVTRNGHAVAGARVQLRGAKGRAVIETHTDRSGEFSLFVPQGSWRVDIREASWYVSKVVDVDAGFTYLEIDLDKETSLHAVQ